MSKKSVLVMGGTRFMGLPTVRRLIERGHDVTVFNRGTRPDALPGDVAQIRGDRDNDADLAKLAAKDFDAVIDYSAYFPEQVTRLHAAIPDIPSLVHISSSAVYAEDPVIPWPETNALSPSRLWGQYSVNKLNGETALREARTGGSTAVLRPPYVLGPNNYNLREEFILNRILDGAEVLIPGDGQAAVQMMSTEQVAYSAVAIVESPPAGWQDYNVGSEWYITLPGIVESAARVVGKPGRSRIVGGGAFGPGLDGYDATNFIFPFPNAPLALDVSKLAADGYAPPAETMDQMFAVALEDLLKNPERRKWELSAAEIALGATR